MEIKWEGLKGVESGKMPFDRLRILDRFYVGDFGCGFVFLCRDTCVCVLAS